jgi:hypothetical protein
VLKHGGRELTDVGAAIGVELHLDEHLEVPAELSSIEYCGDDPTLRGSGVGCAPLHGSRPVGCNPRSHGMDLTTTTFSPSGGHLGVAMGRQRNGS